MIVDVVAAIHEHPLPLVVIDMGTATTLSVADKRAITQAASFYQDCVFP